MIIKIDNEENIGKRLDSFLVEYFKNEYSRKNICDFIAEKEVLINLKKAKSSNKLKLNDEISIDEVELDKFLNPTQALEPYNYKLDIVYEDEDLAVINKPKNMLTHPTKFDRKNTLANALLYNFKNLSSVQGEDRRGIVHRLDKNTAGLILIAKNDKAHIDLAKQIKEKSAKRKYLAIALGEFNEKEGTINKPLVHYMKDNVKMTVAPEGLEAITHFKVVEEYKGATLVELELETGRTHQIRAHLASINHPVFNDSLYGAKSFMRNEFYNLKTTEQLLQSYYIKFKQPTTGETLEFQLSEEEFSEDFIKVLNFLRRKNNV